ncbi:MAG: sialidase family protein [Bryobacterales bacterium]|nr:sialidase family protein [Bryobacterales bacterium]
MRFLLSVLPVLCLTVGCNTVPDRPAETSDIHISRLFEAEQGGYAHYRVPAITVSPAGTVMVVVEARASSSGDWGLQDILMRRSFDWGETWDEPRKIVELEGVQEPNEAALAQGLTEPGVTTYNNIVPIADPSAGVVHFLVCSAYARAYYTRTEDDGETFTEPVEITDTFEKFREEYDWKVIATGPGHGIRHSNGRLIVPVWLSDGTGGHAHRPSIVSTIYSDDGGATWERGDVVVRHPELKNPSETLAVELSDGTVMLNIRNESPEHRRAVTIGPDGASGWSEIRFDEDLVEPICMGSLLRVGDALLFANPDSTEPRSPENPEGNWKRQNLSIRISEDDGETWPYKRVIEPGVSGYSDLASDGDGNIYCVYEDGTPSDRGTHVKYLSVARFKIDWIRGGRAM